MPLLTSEGITSVLQKLTLMSTDASITRVTYIPIIGSLVLMIVVLKIHHQKRILSQKLNVPGPQSNLFVGMLPYVIKHWDFWPRESTRLSKVYGKTWGSVMPNIGPLPVAYLFIHHENNVKHVLRDNFENYMTVTLGKVLPEVLGKGIFATNGDEWKLHRKVMSNMFTRNLMRSATSFSAEKMLEVVRLFREEISKNSVNDEQGFIDVDIQDVFHRLTFDIICKVAFGLDLKSVENKKQHEFPLAFNEIVCLSQERIHDLFFEIKKYFGVGQREKRIYELDHIIQDFYSRIIRDKQSNPTLEGFDVFSTYITYAKKSNVEVKDGDLKDIAMSLLLAGRDTTTSALAWLWYELTRHPKVVEKIIEEVQSICGIGDSADYSFDAMNKLKYTHCVAMEALRLHPPVPNDPRRATSDDVLPDGTYVPAGGQVIILVRAMGRAEHIWGDDAELFRPERFMGKIEPSPFKFPTFWGGPRMCLGRPLAMMEMKLAMSILLTSGLSFNDEIGHSGDLIWRLTMSMKDGFPIRIAMKNGN